MKVPDNNRVRNSWVGCFLTAAALLGLLVIWAFITNRASHENANLETPRTQLELHNGSWFHKGSSNLFSGLMVEFYPDGTRKLRAAITNGSLDGWSEGWHTNGQPQIREFFRAGTADGVRTKWYASGRKLSEAQIQNGKLHGIFRRWHENGQLAEEMTLEDGEPEGRAYAFHPSGYVKARAILRKGALLERKEFPDGQEEQ